MRKIPSGLITALFVILFELVTYYVSEGQGVGIGTAHPLATLHVAGTLRVDTAKSVTTTRKFAVFDSLGVLRSLSADSVMKQQTYYASNESQASTTSAILQVRVTLTLPPGTYILHGYFEAFNANTPSGVRGQMNEGSTEIAYGAPYSDQSTFSPWNAMKQVSPAVTTTYSLLWGSWPSGNTSYIRRARLFAIRIQ